MDSHLRLKITNILFRVFQLNKRMSLENLISQKSFNYFMLMQIMILINALGTRGKSEKNKK